MIVRGNGASAGPNDSGRAKIRVSNIYAHLNRVGMRLP